MITFNYLESQVANEMEKMSILASASTKSDIRTEAAEELDKKFGGTKSDLPPHVVRTAIKEAAERIIERDSGSV